MRTMNWITMGLAASAVAGLGIQNMGSGTATSGVGTHPGGVTTRLDSDAKALADGHALALFAAG
jgi:hypothetical protein